MQQQDKLEEKPFYKRWPFWFVFFYILFVIVYTIAFKKSSGENVLLASNELGDFLAGVFAPLAFLFLYLGYKQQGEELKKQGIELANSVAEQRRLIKIYEDEQKAKHFAAKPFLIFNATHFSIEERPDEVGDDENGYETIMRTYCDFFLSIENKGEVAKHINFTNERNISFWKIYEINKNQKEKRIMELNYDEIKELEINNYFSKRISIEYADQFGKNFSQVILCEISYDPHEEELYLVCKEIIS